jgi:oligoribonuclease NrnB/cAMP/cGMP phosphodiesterase (DHH superfamily)
MTWTPDTVIYHDHCADGFGAAWACWMRWRDGCAYVPASYGQAPPYTEVAGKNVLIVDFSYRRGLLEEMAKEAASIVILDHHKTAQADLEPFTITLCGTAAFVPEDAASMFDDFRELDRLPVAASFDMERSGARIAWDFCFPRDEAPLLIRLIEDRDLWRFTMEDTKPFSLWLRSEPFSFDRFELLSQQLGDGHDSHEIMTEARAMQRFFDAKVSEIVSFASRRRIGEHEAIAVNCPPMFASEVGHALLEKHADAPFSATYYDGPKARMWSLRSRDDRVDVSAVASKFGGGGHRNAAGFSAPL